LAREAGFVQRQSKVSALMFTKTLFFDHLSTDQPSLARHSFGIFNDHGKKISKQALHKRFNESAVGFVKGLFERYLQHQLQVKQLPSALADQFTAIRIMDSTVFKLPASLATAFPGFGGDGTKACAKVQFEFDLLSGSIRHLNLDHARVSDKAYSDSHQSPLDKGELVLRDLGYYSLDSYDQICQQGAWYVSRLKSQISIYEKRGNGYKALSLGKLIKQLKKSGQDYLDKEVYIGQSCKYPVRLIGNLLDQAAVGRRVARKKHRKKRLTKVDKDSCQLNLFITNLPPEMATAEELYRLYKIRWQVELLFKAFKSIVRLDKVHPMKADRLKCYLYSKLLWIMFNWDICRCVQAAAWVDHGSLLSHYKCFGLLMQQAAALKDKLFCQRKTLREWLLKICQGLIDYGLREKRKNRMGLSDLLQMKQPATL
jgi:hypothetical protein